MLHTGLQLKSGSKHREQKHTARGKKDFKARDSQKVVVESPLGKRGGNKPKQKGEGRFLDAPKDLRGEPVPLLPTGSFQSGAKTAPDPF